MLRPKMDGLLKSQDRARIRSGQDLGATLRGAVLQTVWVARLASNPRIYMPLRKCQAHVPCCSSHWSGRLERGRKAVQYGSRGDGTSVRRKVSTSSLKLTDCPSLSSDDLPSHQAHESALVFQGHSRQTTSKK